MTQFAQSVAASSKAELSPSSTGAAQPAPFCGLIDPVLVDGPVAFRFAGSVDRAGAQAIWTWLARDFCPDLLSLAGIENGALKAPDLEPLLPELLTRLRTEIDRIRSNAEATRRFRVQLGREHTVEETAVVIAALRNRALLAKAQGFGRAVNTMTDESALATALHSMPLQDAQVASLVFHGLLGQVGNPSRLIGAAIKLSGGATEVALSRAGLSPLIDAFLAHAQNQLAALQLTGPFADNDRACRSLDRFHRLMRGLTGYIEFSRISPASQALASITKLVSDKVEPRLKEVVTDLNQAMRRPREGMDRIDQDRMLAAINGIYLLSAVRDSRDSLALNALFDQVWSQAGQALELHIQRNLDLLRQNPADAPTGARLDSAIKMAEIRFNPDYAETLKRARAAAERRA